MKAEIKRSALGAVSVLAALVYPSAHVDAQNAVLPSSFAVPADAVKTFKRGFLVRTWMSPGEPNSIEWAEEQLAGLHGENTANTADFADTIFGNFYFDEPYVINYWDSGGAGNFPNDNTQNVPGVLSADNYSLEIFTLLDLPAGPISMGVNSDDGFRVTALRTPDPRERLAVKLGEFEGTREAGDTLFEFEVPQAGIYPFRLVYEQGQGDSEVEWFTIAQDGTKHLINDLVDANSIKAYRALNGAARAYAQRALPAPGDRGTSPSPSIDIELVDADDNPIDASTVKLSLDGTPLAVTLSKTGGVTTLMYTPASLFDSGSTHKITLSYTEGSTPTSVDWTFTVQSYIALPPIAKVTPDTSKPGFLWNIFINQANSTTSNQRAEDALAGRLRSADGSLLSNVANPSAQGVALAAGKKPTTANSPISFEIPTVINVSQTAGDYNGNFPNDDQMPGVPGTDGSTDGLAAEILTFIELPAGVTTMGINCDDGFRTSAGNSIDGSGFHNLAEFDGARVAGDTLFNVIAQEAGVYAFRTLYQAGIGGASIEWWSLKADGTRVLINDTANGGLMAYRAQIGGTDPVVPPQTNKPSSGPIYSLGLNFGSDEPAGNNKGTLAATDKAGVPGVAQANWNNLKLFSGTNSSIVADRNGRSERTSATVIWAANRTWASTGRGEENNKLTGADLALMTGYLDTGNSSTSAVMIIDIPDQLTGPGYDIYVYANGGVEGSGGAYRILDGDTDSVIKEYVQVQTPSNATSYIQAVPNSDPNVWATGNYIIFSGLTASSVIVEATSGGGHGLSDAPRAPINAVQLVSPPSASPTPTLIAQRTTSGTRLIFQGTLQSSARVQGPYVDVAGAASPANIPIARAAEFYRAKQ